MSTFSQIDPAKILGRSKHFFLIEDGFPVTPGHLLIISNKMRQDYFDLDQEEREDLDKAIIKAKIIIEKKFQPDGFNIGMNCGEAAGQTVFHFHCHVIPRYVGDMKDPRGGVRHSVEGRGYY